jgi:hypothetical protein
MLKSCLKYRNLIFIEVGDVRLAAELGFLCNVWVTRKLFPTYVIGTANNITCRNVLLEPVCLFQYEHISRQISQQDMLHRRWIR